MEIEGNKKVKFLCKNLCVKKKYQAHHGRYNVQFSSNFWKQLNIILITIKYDLPSYSWRKDIISVKLIVKAGKNEKSNTIET